MTGTVTVWECNIPPQYCNGAQGLPGEGAGGGSVVAAGCGCILCQTSAQAALADAQQILAMQSVSVDPGGPPLQCRGPLATLSAAYDTGSLFTVNECTQVTQATCRPCDDGQGGTLQSVGQYCNTGEGMAPVPGGYQCCAGLTCTSTDTESGTCQGTLATCPPAQPNWQPLDTATLRNICTNTNINGAMSQSGVTFNRTCGVAFETWVLTTLGVLPKPPGPNRNATSFMSKARMTANNGLPASVIPEFVGNQTGFPQSVLYEVKAVTGALTPGTSSWQILGLLDVANTQTMRDAGAYPPPVVFFITTGNTTVSTVGTASSPGVVAYGNMWSVAIWQQRVLYDANGGNNPNLTLAAPTCLTPNLCGQSAAPVAVPNNLNPPISPLTAPTTPPSSVIVPGDPDPAEVD